MSGFVAAFNERENIAGVPETKGIPGGLEEVLAGTLSCVVSVNSSMEEFPRADIPETFTQDFERVLRSFPGRHPIAFLFFKEKIERHSYTAVQYLEALLRDYIRRRKVYPY